MYSYELSQPITRGTNKGKCVAFILRDGVRIASTKPLSDAQITLLAKIVKSSKKMEAWMKTVAENPVGQT